MGVFCAVDLQTFSVIKQGFRDYYTSDRCRFDFVVDPKFRHFRVRFFKESGEQEDPTSVLQDAVWVRVVDKVYSGGFLKRFLGRFSLVVHGVFHSVLSFIFSKEVRGRGDGVPCLGGPLVFDFDAFYLIGGRFLLPRDSDLERLKEEVLCLRDFVRGWFGYRDFCYVFSGFKGFHLYVRDFDLEDHVFGGVDFLRREVQELGVRRWISSFLLGEGFRFDRSVTPDTRRIIRVPGSINGHTGLKAKIFRSEGSFLRFRLHHSVVFPWDDFFEVRFNSPVQMVMLNDEVFGSFRKNEVVKLPKPIAFLYALNGYCSFLANEPS